MSKLDKILHYFPETELPVLISEDHLSEFEINSDPFPQVFIDEVLLEWEKDADEFTEFIPCFRLPKEEKFNAIVYWKGALLRYDFVLVTLDKNGELINKKSIASTIVNAGQTLDGEEYDASMSKAFAMEILPTGEIIFAMDSLN